VPGVIVAVGVAVGVIGGSLAELGGTVQRA
jgi:hypothetical protein